MKENVMEYIKEYQIYDFKAVFVYTYIWKIYYIQQLEVEGSFSTTELDSYILFLQFVSRQLNILNGVV